MTHQFDLGDVHDALRRVLSRRDRQPPARATGTRIVAELEAIAPRHLGDFGVDGARPGRAALEGADRRSGLVVAGIRGGENQTQGYARELTDRLIRDRNGAPVRAGGDATVDVEITEQSQRDLFLMESLAIPMSFVVLVSVFGGLVSAAVRSRSAAWRSLAARGASGRHLFADVSIFALDLSAAMGLALAIDHTLLILSRYRDELADGGTPRKRWCRRGSPPAGRCCSATIVALSMAVMVLFPMAVPEVVRLRRHGDRGRRRRGRAGGTPAALVMLGDRVQALDLRRLVAAEPSPA